MNSIPVRRPYQGVLQILQFNWRMYVATAVASGAMLIVAPFLHRFLDPFLDHRARMVVWLCAAPALFWMVSSLLVSHYVYDRFPLYELGWMSKALSNAPRQWINIHCGLDETSTLLEAIFPDAAGHVVDIFDAQIMTEPSIRQARQANRGSNIVSTHRSSHGSTHSSIPAEPARHNRLPFRDNWFDAAFSIFAAHELRHHQQRLELFDESRAS